MADKGKLLAHGRTAEVFEWGDGQVIKLLRAGFSASALERESAKTRAAYDAGLPVPKTYGIVEVEGRQGIVFERVVGPSLLQEAMAGRVALPDAARLLAELHAELHERSIPGLPSLKERMKVDIQAATSITNELRQAALDALDRLPDGDAVCHGDFHPDNVLMSPRGPMVIDWNNATRGNPLADVAKTLALINAGSPPPDLRLGEQFESARNLINEIYLERYAELRGVARQQIEAWLLPVAAARLWENIAGERERLLAMVEKSLAR
ncbi:MAG: phosphotransferase [Chloroflexi bacterium]|nr:phosphotransferase [Chloroflexota bacterium]